MAGVSDSNYLSMTELARRLDLPESTMRYYCKRFAKFLPYKGEGRRRRYALDTEKTLVFIANAMHRNKNATAVELMLQSGQYNLPATGQESGATAQAQAALPAPGASAEPGQLLFSIMERQAEALGRIAEGLGKFVDRLDDQGTMDAASLTNGVNGSEVEALRQEVNELRQQMFTAEAVHQEDLEQLRKWLGRMGEAVARLGS